MQSHNVFNWGMGQAPLKKDWILASASRWGDRIPEKRDRQVRNDKKY
jgi:hypothetical protein